MRLYLSIILLILAAVPALSREMIIGPVEADVVRVRDGDSIDVIAHIWPGHDVRVSIRIRGIDAPEINARCGQEKELAIAAREKLKEILHSRKVRLYRISGGKYFGRMLSAVEAQNGQDITKAMMKSGLVRAYRGRKRQSWCPENVRLTN